MIGQNPFHRVHVAPCWLPTSHLPRPPNTTLSSSSIMTTLQLLERSIDNANAESLRQLVRELCCTPFASDACRDHAARHLLMLPRKRKISAIQDSPAKKSKTPVEERVPKFDRCVACNASYNITQNFADVCHCHSGSLPPPLTLQILQNASTEVTEQGSSKPQAKSQPIPPGVSIRFIPRSRSIQKGIVGIAAMS
jgi:hypothetical protein